MPPKNRAATDEENYLKNRRKRQVAYAIAVLMLWALIYLVMEACNTDPA